MNPFFKMRWLALAVICMTMGVAMAETMLPIPAKASPTDMPAFERVITASRERDVDVSEATALLNHGMSLLQAERHAECIPFLEEAIRRDPVKLYQWEALGWAYFKTGDKEKTKHLWDYFRQLMPDEWLPYSLLAQLAIERQDWEAADGLYRKALSINPTHFDMRFAFARNLMHLGGHQEAEKTLRTLAKEEPDRLDVQLTLAVLLVHQLEYDEALSLLRHYNDELPGNVVSLMDQANLEVRVGDLKTADHICLNVLALEPQNTRALTLRANMVEISDTSDLNAGRLRQLIEATPDPRLRSKFRQRMAVRCTAINKRRPGTHSNAFIRNELLTAIGENPTDAALQVFYAETCFMNKQYGESRKYAVNVLEHLNRHNLRAKQVLFEIALAERRFDDAEQVLNDLFTHFAPSSPLRHYYAARVHMLRGSYRDALKMLDKLEQATNQGCVLTLLYNDLTESDNLPIVSVRRMNEHLTALRREGFTFISPADIPNVLGTPDFDTDYDEDILDDLSEAPSVPWTARMIDTVRYGITGERKFKPAAKQPQQRKRPAKLVSITFDGGLRSAFLLGSEIADDIGVPFGMFVATKPEKEYKPSIAGWKEIKEYAASGQWVIGSQLYDANNESAVDSLGTDIRYPLPNRLWLPGKNRIETLSEWDRRIRGEFRLSRNIIAKQLGGDDSDVPMVSYPYGDVAQDAASNLFAVRNPVSSIVTEAARKYKVGFIQTISGYTVAGEDPLMSHRYMPLWYDEGTDVVRHAYEWHPLFMARRLRVELAFLMNKPHMAEEMLTLMKRDGYPDELCDQITANMRLFFRNRPKRDTLPLLTSVAVPVDSVTGGSQNSAASHTQLAQAERRYEKPQASPASRRGIPMASSSSMPAAITVISPTAMQDTHHAEGEDSDFVAYDKNRAIFQDGKDTDPWLAPAHPFAGVELSHTKANDQFEITRWGARAGLSLNRNTQLSVEYFESDIEQRIRPVWNAVSFDPDDLTRYTFKALKREARAHLTYRTASGATFSGSFGAAKFDPDYDEDALYDLDLEDRIGSDSFSRSDDDLFFIGDLSATWAPRDDLTLYVFYARDLVTSAVKPLSSDSVGAVARWKPDDEWHVTLRSQYWNYEDDNALFYLQGDSFWEVSPDMGVWLGIDASTISAADPCDYYWTPYWDKRVMGVLRYYQFWQGYTFRLDFLGGLQSQDNRPVRREEERGFGAGGDWEMAWGLSSTYNKRVTDYFDIFLDGSIMAMRDYIDHRLLIGFSLTF